MAQEDPVLSLPSLPSPSIQYLHIDALDTADFKLLPHFLPTSEYIAQCLSRGEGVLVHCQVGGWPLVQICRVLVSYSLLLSSGAFGVLKTWLASPPLPSVQAGVSRSASIVVAHLMTHGLGVQDTETLAQVRLCACFLDR